MGRRASPGSPPDPRERLVDIELLGGEAGHRHRPLLAEYLGHLAPRLRVRMRLGSTKAIKQRVRSGGAGSGAACQRGHFAGSAGRPKRRALTA